MIFVFAHGTWWWFQVFILVLFVNISSLLCIIDFVFPKLAKRQNANDDGCLPRALYIIRCDWQSCDAICAGQKPSFFLFYWLKWYRLPLTQFSKQKLCRKIHFPNVHTWRGFIPKLQRYFRSHKNVCCAHSRNTRNRKSRMHLLLPFKNWNQPTGRHIKLRHFKMMFH